MKRLFSILAITFLMAIGTVNANATTLASTTATVTSVAQDDTDTASEDLSFHQA